MSVANNNILLYSKIKIANIAFNNTFNVFGNFFIAANIAVV